MPSQQNQNQTYGSSLLRIPASSSVILRYQENGHTTMPWIPSYKHSPGLVYVYGTSHSLPTDTIFTVHDGWNIYGSGGDQRGRLLKVDSFDDGECYAPTGSPEAKRRMQSYPPDPGQGLNRWCGNEVFIPIDVKGLYTLYWVWDWPSSADMQQEVTAKIEIYTTCLDIWVD
jgi:hypothetical protein